MKPRKDAPERCLTTIIVGTRSGFIISDPDIGDMRMADPRNTAGDEWVSVGAYPDVESAQAVSGRLSIEGVESRLVAREPGGPLFGVLGEWSVLVPRESVEAAERILAEPPPTDAELTALALEDPPPDDFDASANPPVGPEARDESGR